MIVKILHPSDFKASSELAFYHALKLTLLTKGTLTLLHVPEGHERDGSGFPGIRETLERWGVLAPGSSRESVGDLGVQIRKVMTHRGDPVETTLHYLGKHPVDLMVLGNHASRWLQHPELCAREIGEMTLFLPRNTGFVSPEDGSVSLSNILIPIGQRPEVAITAACLMADTLCSSAVTFTLMHVVAFDEMHGVQTEHPGWTWNELMVEDADPISAIPRVAATVCADLIVMATDGHEGFLDNPSGNTIERMIKGSRYPVLAVHSH